jgi:hypothetical protein
MHAIEGIYFDKCQVSCIVYRNLMFFKDIQWCLIVCIEDDISHFLLGLEHGHVYGPIDTTNHSIGTISNTTRSKNYLPPLSVVPSHAPFLLSSHNTIPVSTGNNSLQGTARTEFLSKMKCICYAITF